jgi:hypothetical protein
MSRGARSFSRAPRSTASPVSSRRGWLDLLDQARRLSRGDLPERRPGEALLQFLNLARRTRAAEFPIRGDSARLMAEAFLTQARAFCVAGLPELRAAYGPALSASTACLEGMLDQQRRADAEIGRRVLGERDD